MDSFFSLSLLAFVGVTAIAAMSGGFFMPGEWYERLKKPSWCPPNWLFAPVWFVLYAMIAVSAWLVWRQAGFGLAMVAFGVQLVLNAMWSWLFFGLRRPDLAFYEVIGLWISIALMIAVFFQTSVSAAALLIPYLAWVTLAATLNYSVWRLNADTIGAEAGRA